METTAQLRDRKKVCNSIKSLTHTKKNFSKHFKCNFHTLKSVCVNTNYTKRKCLN